MAGDHDEIRERLEAIGEELADLALDRLRRSVEDGCARPPAAEKRLTQARRAVERAVRALAEIDSDGDRP